MQTQRYIVKLIILFITTLFSIKVAAQVNSFTHYTPTDGLASISVDYIEEDSEGFLYFCTSRGLSIYDGNSFINFDAQNTPDFSNNLTCLLEIDTYHLLIASRDKGLYLFNKKEESIKHISFKNKILQDIIRLAIDSTGTIWIGCSNGALYCLDNKSKLLNSKNIHLELCSEKFPLLTTLLPYKEGILLCNSESAVRLISKKNGEITIQPAISLNTDTKVSTGCLLNKDTYAFYTTNGIHIYQNKADQWNLLQIIPNAGGMANYIEEYNDTYYYIISSKLYKQGVDSSQHAPMLISNSINEKKNTDSHHLSLKIDTNGQLWSGTWFDGALRYNLKSPLFTPYLKDATESPAITWSVGLIPNSEALYIGGISDGLSYTSNKNEYQLASLKNTSSSAWYQYTDTLTNKLYIGTWGEGLDCLNKTTKEYSKNITQQLRNQRIFFIDRFDNESFFLGTGEKGLFVYNENTGDSQNIQFNNTQLPQLNVRDVLVDKQKPNTYWMATLNEGLFHFKLNNQLQAQILHHYPTLNGEKMQITSLYQKENRIWLTLTNGLAHFNRDDKSVIIHKIPSLEGILVNQMLAIDDHNFWLASHSGLLLYNEKLSDFITYMNNQIHYKLAYDSDDKQIYTCTSDGLYQFDPKRIKSMALDEQVILRSLEVNGVPITPSQEKRNTVLLQQSITYTDTLTLSPSAQNFSLNMSVHSAREQNGFTAFYQLKGFDSFWNRCDQKNQTIRYSNLPAGKYELIIRLMNADNKIGQRTLYLIKEEYWYKTMEAKICYAVLFILILTALLVYTKQRYKKRYVRQLKIADQESKEKVVQQRLRFFTNISHDIKTPLTLLLSPLDDLINHPEMPANFLERLQSMYANGDILMKKINKILRYRNQDIIKNQLTYETYSLQQLFNDVVFPFKEYAERQGIQFNFTGIEETTSAISFITNRERIESILENLISNAIKYTPEGGEIKIHYILINEQVQCKVSDTGQGITAEHLPHLFDRYYRIESNSKGTGLGLYLVKNYIEQLNGSIQVTSKPAEGTTFTFQLPLHPIETAAISGEETQPKVEDTENMIQILVVDDNKEIREYLKQLLSPFYNVIQANNGIEAVDAIKHQIPDLILSDMMMEGMDGVTFCQQMKGNMLTSHIPFIILTAKGDIETRRLCWEAGVDLFEEKPFKSQLLLAKIANLLRSRRLLKYKYQIASPSSGDGKDADRMIETPENKQQDLDLKFIRTVNTVIEKHKNNPELSIQELADELSMRHDQLYRKLKVLTGLSANQYIRTYRLNCAAILLKSGKYTVTEVLYSVGFNNPSYFSKCFKKEFEKLPSEYIPSNDTANANSDL